MFRQFLRGIGMGLVLVGAAVLIFACASYLQQTEAEKQAEANVPGQGIQTEPAVLPTLVPNTATVTAAPSPTLPEPSTTPSPLPTQPGPTPTPTNQMVVGASGMPVGLGSIPVRLVIPRMKLDARVEQASWDVVNENGQQVSEWQIPYDAAGHLKTTPKPGERGNAVISGHNNLTAPNVFGVGLFAGLWNLKVGDPVYITDKVGRTLLFQVSESFYLKELGEPLAVREQHAQQIMQDDGTPVVTFETCWNGHQAPLSGNTYRWVVRARLVGTVDGSQIPAIKASM